MFEEIDENQTDQLIRYDPTLTFDLQMVIVKLMNHSLYPLIYNEIHEREAKNSFAAVFVGEKLKQFVAEFESLHHTNAD
jgi:hypothetical protein